MSTLTGPDVVCRTDLSGLPPPRRGKVRDVYDLGETILIVACDRLSAYDHVLRPAIPGKGKILNQLTNFWFERFAGRVEGHLLATDPADFPPALARHRAVLAGRAVIARKAAVVAFECVARGYLAGSGYREYAASGAVCGVALSPGLARAGRLPQPIFTPATKAASGHDENVPFPRLAAAVGEDLAGRLRELTLDLYGAGAAHAAACGLLLADTKLEFGLLGGRLLLIDEVMTPDSSRFWDAATWRPGREPASIDKQYVRDWLDASGWDHESEPPELPPRVVEETRRRYVDAFRRLTGREPQL